MIGREISHFRIIDNIGSGGMGVVYKAEDLALHRTVALKFLPPEYTRDQEAKQRFFQEARAASGLDHPNICTVHEIDETSDGQVFMVMTYYEGETLKKIIQRGPLPINQAIEIAIHVSSGLGYAHEAGIIHRDIKPANIMLTRRGEIKILDFGLAKLIGQAALTQTQTTLGTAYYMSPEQIKGEAVDHRTDIWSLGVVLYEMMTGKMPFGGDYGPAIIYTILHEQPEPVSGFCPEITPPLEQIINRCLEKNPATRFTRIVDLGAALQQCGGGATGRSVFEQDTQPLPPISPSDKTVRDRAKPHHFLKVAVPLGLAVLVLSVLLLLSPTRNIVWKWFGLYGLPAEKHLVILPFTASPADPDNQAIADGLVEMLTLKMNQLEEPQGHFWVVSAADLRDGPATTLNNAHGLHGVNLVLSGKMNHQGDTVQLRLQLIDPNHSQVLASREITDHISSVSTFQDGVVLALAEMLDLKLDLNTQQRLARGGTALPGAYIAWVQGRGLLRNWKDPQCLEKALQLFRQAIGQDPDFALAHGTLGIGYWRKFEITNDKHWLEAAKAACQTAIRLDSEYPTHYLVLGLIERDTGKTDAAAQNINQALLLAPGYFDACILLGLTYRQMEKLKEAEEAFKRAIQLRPDYWIGYSNLGYFYYFYGRYPEAEKMFQYASQAAPQNTTPYSNLAAVYWKMSQIDKTFFYLEKSLMIQPSAQGFNNIGTLYFNERRYTEAASNFEKALTIGPDLKNDDLLWGNLAECCQKIPGKEKAANDAFRVAISLAEKQRTNHPDDPSLLSRLAIYHAKMNNPKTALIEIEQARKLAPKDLEILLKSIRINELSSQRDQALQALQEYIQRYGTLEQIQKDLDLTMLRKDPRYQIIIQNSGHPTPDLKNDKPN